MSANDEQVGGSHYKGYTIQPWDFIVINQIPFLEANIIVYTIRHARKNGIEDLKKARHFLDKLIEVEEDKIVGKHLNEMAARQQEQYLPTTPILPPDGRIPGVTISAGQSSYAEERSHVRRPKLVIDKGEVIKDLASAPSLDLTGVPGSDIKS